DQPDLALQVVLDLGHDARQQRVFHGTLDGRLGDRSVCHLVRSRESGSLIDQVMTNALQCPTNDETKTPRRLRTRSGLPSSLVGHWWGIRHLPVIFLAASAASSIGPTYMNADSGS